MKMATIRPHPSDPSVVCVTWPAEHSALMGNFGPARWSAPTKAYLVHLDDLEAFGRFMRIHGAYIVDERTRQNTRIPDPLPECRHCGQPAATTAELAHCPACGEAWDPILVLVTDVARALENICTTCRHVQRGGFPHCANCGGTMATIAPQPAVHARPRRKDPQHISDAVRETLDELGAVP